MRKDILQMTDEERWNRVGELLYKGAVLLAEEERQKKSGVSQTIKPDEDFYSLKELANLLEVSHRTLQRWIVNGKLIPRKKVKGQWVIDAKQVRHLRVQRGDISVFAKADGPQPAKIPDQELSHSGIVEVKKRGKNKGKVLDLICPNDRKRLGDLPLDFFDTDEGKGFMRNKRKVIIKCTKCQQFIDF